MSDYYIWKRGEITHLNSYFTTKEFTCKCSHSDCVDQKISKTLVGLILDIRQKLNAPVSISSGFRCRQHQDDLRAQGLETAKGISTHELGDAADLVASDMKELESLCEARFHAYGVAKSFIHVDMRPAHADGTPRTWTYSKS